MLQRMVMRLSNAMLAGQHHHQSQQQQQQATELKGSSAGGRACKKLMKFLFSHIGLCGMVVAYAVAGTHKTKILIVSN